ncbi:MAG: prepilin-type N-terminal cleavage/methylation domain-containing protein, partial [Pirellulales bacterium]
QPLAPASHRRRGISLVELLAAMAAASVVMATAMGLVHTSYRLESRARLVRSDEQTALRLARQFRTDVHEARTVMQPGVANNPLVSFTGPTGRIDYRPLAQGLVRTTQPATGPTAREEFVFSKPIDWTAEMDRGLVTLRGSSTTDGRHPPLAIEAAAAVPRDKAFAREEGASP